MKKTLLALAVLGAFAGAAQAQSAVTIYGSFDGGIRNLTNVDAAGNNKLTMGSNGTYNSNRLGFKGVEDLGGGLNAHFNLESGFNTGTGTLDNATSTLFNRTASVGLGGAWGNLDFGRQYTVAFRTVAVFDPFRYQYPGLAYAVPATAGVRYNNDIAYYGSFGPVTVRAEYALGEVAGDNSKGSNAAVGAIYSDGKLSAGASYTKRKDAVTDLSTDHYTIGGGYQFGPARITAGYVEQKADNVGVLADSKTRWAWGGINYAITPVVELTYAYYQTKQDGGVTPTFLAGKKDLNMLAVTYDLSKRTRLYAGLDYTKLHDGLRVTGAAGTQDKQTGLSLGVNHWF